MKPTLKFFVGQIVHHNRFDYRGVVVDVDATFQGSEAWYEHVARSRPPKEQSSPSQCPPSLSSARLRCFLVKVGLWGYLLVFRFIEGGCSSTTLLLQCQFMECGSMWAYFWNLSQLHPIYIGRGTNMQSPPNNP